ncbi:hypothetical protein CVT24_009927 [Panaeolus cyanescens]|uniref:Uncharacterized protein n=1 Tax=Panaeolus cyanescens TaxID=181874 RepID=A0A409W451_9AGAR|nr:hypothetical protein CVT24_009927 [Panaeolus cyanescens]
MSTQHTEKPVNVGFVGLSPTGWAAATLAPALLHPNLEGKFKLVAISNSSAASSTAAAEKYGKEAGNRVNAYHGSTAQIASDPDVDLVVVSVKAPMHKELALPVIEQGKDIFIEWPAGRTFEETLEIAEAAKKKGVKTIVNLQARNSLVMRKVKDLIDSGAIGKVRSATSIMVGPREDGLWSPYITGHYKYTVDKASGATALIIPIGHQLDAFTFILGHFTSITASASRQYPTSTVLDHNGNPTDEILTTNTPDQYTFSGPLTSGAHATIMWRGGVRKTKGRKLLQWEIEGDEGLIRIESERAPWVQMANPDVYLNGERVEIEGLSSVLHPEAAFAEPVGIQIQSWKEIAKGPEVGRYATIDDAVKNRRILEAVEKSAAEGVTVHLKSL